ncbi:NAD-dependent epimerase/dehydratase family protein [Aurantimonas sp. CSK15Z-1]|nr:NAD-dependent epimerase/dehydratase family protein [Aurantimonas sp. CSK15Z-1]MCQ8782977.1 NAD-dependent epimerase/dehydratase family protein [Aurantimonas sp. CSK15Z-1]
MTDMTVPARTFGFVEWFRQGEYERVEDALAGMAAAKATQLRTHLSWAEFYAPGGPEWFDWLIPKLGAAFDLLPCIHYTPPSLSRTGKSSGPPRRLLDYADFVDVILTRYGRHFTHIELWNEPNNLLDWDFTVDHEWLLFCEMIGAAAHWAQERGWKTVLGGPCPFDPNWLELMGQRGVLAKFSAVGLHGFPGTWDSADGSWQGWAEHHREMRRILDRHNPAAEVWITEAGYSTWRHDELGQLRQFLDLLEVPADRLYWYSWQDLAPEVAVQEGHFFDQRHYHLGVVDPAGRQKLLARALTEGGVAKARALSSLAAPSVARPSRPITILGGAGFIGANLAESLLKEGREVLVVDNFSRPGVERNLDWLKREHGERVHVAAVDLRDRQTTAEVVADAGAVFHLAAQVAVTTSLVDPFHDFAVNAQGTLNVLEGLRRTGRKVPAIFASTNKVYGGLEDVAMVEGAEAYAPADAAIRENGIGEWRNLDFCTPYGCSKGVADQYVLDYAKSYGLPTAVLRMSCIYGPRQFGTEDQGWVAHFLIRALRGEPITIYGDGKQVRDILHVADAVAAYRLLLDNIEQISGRAFNLGGGPANAVSLRTVLREIERIAGRPLDLSYGDWRQGDQLYFVADTRKLTDTLGWQARTAWREGLDDLARWLQTGEGPVPATGAALAEDAPRHRVPA